MCKDTAMAIVSTPLSEDQETLYESEQNSDVTFVAGLGCDTWRFPGHRSVLASANQVFYAMLYGPIAHSEDVIYIKDVDKRAFEQLLRYLYGQRVEFKSVATARATLDVAHKYICPGLVKECVSYLDLHLTPSTVLEVFQDLRLFCSHVPPPGTAPCAPTLNSITSTPMTEFCDSLMHNCLLFIDENADEVLEQEIIEELGYEDVAIIAPRDSLKVNCEMKLFLALSKWCNSECKKRQKVLTSENRRQVLGALSYSVRYLLMTEQEFTTGPQASELLKLDECNLIINHMRGNQNFQLTYKQQEMLDRFGTSRVGNSQIKPVHLSERSISKEPVEVDSGAVSDGKSKKKKTKKKKESKKGKKIEAESDVNSSGCSCACFGNGLVRALLCVFD